MEYAYTHIYDITTETLTIVADAGYTFTLNLDASCIDEIGRPMPWLHEYIQRLIREQLEYEANKDAYSMLSAKNSVAKNKKILGKLK